MRKETIFVNRVEAGKKLADKLSDYAGKEALVYALPRGGVLVAAEVAKALDLPLDLVITRKIGHPINSEYAVGAVSISGETVFDPRELKIIDRSYIKVRAQAEMKEAQRRRKTYLGERKPILARGKTAILVDDGLATGLSMIAAIREIKNQKPREIIVAVPVTPRDNAEKIKREKVDLVALLIPEYFLGAIGAYYHHFDQVSDEQVVQTLESLAKNL